MPTTETAATQRLRWRSGTSWRSSSPVQGSLVVSGEGSPGPDFERAAQRTPFASPASGVNNETQFPDQGLWTNAPISPGCAKRHSQLSPRSREATYARMRRPPISRQP